MLLRALHAVGNITSPHTLLSSFEMQENDIIVDDVFKRHIKSHNGEKGTQSIAFKDGTCMLLKCKHTLMSFHTSKPTMKEVETLPTCDIAIENWNPLSCHEAMGDDVSVTSVLLH